MTPPPPARRRAANGTGGIVLAPGASAGREQPALVAIDDALSAAGMAVVRIDFPYHLAGRRAPDRPSVLMATIVEAAGALAASTGIDPAQVALGGRSMGGRICSMAVAGCLLSAAPPG
ncbi:MAG: alpha/beta family hydrolase [Acidimicrobiales bacterium]